jgi:hypothetical protein
MHDLKGLWDAVIAFPEPLTRRTIITKVYGGDPLHLLEVTPRLVPRLSGHLQGPIMSRLAIALVLTLAGSLAMPAFAQTKPAPRPTTTWEPVEQPLNALLNGGYKIIAMTGPSFTLEKDGKYILCDVRSSGSGNLGDQACSECYRLN